MEIKRLNSDVISKIRSSFNINSVAQCVFELVCNSLDAKSTSIAVRINLITFKIQVADNGEGITKENLELLGIRYMTSKCCNLRVLEKHLNTYGFRGEALASIVDMCNSISISSRCNNSSDTYSKIISKDLRSKANVTKHRASVGTTVTVLGFLSNFPVRQQRIIQEIELEEVKKYIESLVIINPESSFSLRNDVTGLLILKSPKSSDIIDSFRHLHPDIKDSFTLLKVSRHKLCIDVLIHKEFSISKKFQYLYVNKRPIISHKILKIFNDRFHNEMQLQTKRSKHPIFDTKRYPIYVLNIKCPQHYVDLFMGPSKTEVEFKCWDAILLCIGKIFKSLFGVDDEKEKQAAHKTHSNARMNCGVSQVLGAVQACAYKRKSDEAIIADGKTNSKADNKVNFQDASQNRRVGINKSRLSRLEEKKAPLIKCGQSKQLRNFVKDKTTLLGNQGSQSSGNYQIEDSGKQKPFLKPRKLKSIIKKPLPIRVKHKLHDIESKFSKDSVFELEITPKPNQAMKIDLADSIIISKGQFDHKSEYSKLNNDEDQGKNLIMDMFLKSTQVFTGEDGESKSGENICPNISGETIEESNFVMENNIRDTNRGINTTMSISVNVKKKRLKEYKNKASKCVQTSIAKEISENRTSKCVQTSQKPSLERVRSNMSDLTHQLDGFKLSHKYCQEERDNYTILINTVRKETEFRFVRKSEEMDVGSYEEEKSFRPLKICHCRENDGKIFKFDQSDKRDVGRLNGKSDLAPTTFKENLHAKPRRNDTANIIDKEPNRDCLFYKENSDAIFKKPQAQVCESKSNGEHLQFNKNSGTYLNFHGIKKQTTKTTGPKNICEKSPFFSKKKVQTHSPQITNFINKNLEQGVEFFQPLHRDFQPKFQSTQFVQNHLDDANCNNNLNGPQINVVPSPYFVKNCRGDAIFPKTSNVCLAGTIRDNYFKPPNLNNRIYEDFQMPQANLLRPNQHIIHRNYNFERNWVRSQHFLNNNPPNQNFCRAQHVDNYGRHTNSNNFLPRICCHENKCQYFEMPEYNGNDFRPQANSMDTFNHYRCYRNQGNINIEARTRNFCPQSNPLFPEHRNLVGNTEILIPNNPQNCNEIIQVHEPRCDHSFEDSYKKERPSSQPIEESKLHFSLEEAPWYTPNVSNKNMYFERPSSEPEEVRSNGGEHIFDETHNVYRDKNGKRCSDQESNNIKEKKSFNFKFSCTPDIFSSEDVCPIEGNSKINRKSSTKSHGSDALSKASDFLVSLARNRRDDFKEPITKVPQHDFHNFFDLTSLGVVVAKDAVRTTNTVCPSNEGSDLEITVVDDQEKHNIIEQELLGVRKNNGNNFGCESETNLKETENNKEKCVDKSRVIVDSENEWVRKYNKNGRGFYINKRTGMVTISTPKIDEGFFIFDKRLDFVPKGMSPVLKEHNKVDRSLSQNAKTKLHDFILESYENELMVIKWQHFISDDPKTFFEEIYKEKSKQFENGIPSIQDSTMKKNLHKDRVNFNSTIFQTVDVIGQVDKKFIAVLEKTRNMVVLFDQHAVHERIRVEQFLNDYKGLKTPCKEKLTYFMPRNDLGLLKKHSTYLSSLGLEVEFFTDGLIITKIPLCVQEKFNSHENSEDLSKIVSALLKEIIENVKETRGSTLQLPKIIHNIINLKACRGAIKFGDNLTNEDCIKLLKDLGRCKLPFQCAHGRPTLTPVLTLSKVELKTKNNKLNFKKLLQR